MARPVFKILAPPPHHTITIWALGNQFTLMMIVVLRSHDCHLCSSLPASYKQSQHGKEQGNLHVMSRFTTALLSDKNSGPKTVINQGLSVWINYQKILYCFSLTILLLINQHSLPSTPEGNDENSSKTYNLSSS